MEIKIPLRIEKKECSLDGLTFFEKVNIEVLDALIDSNLLKKTFNHKICENFYENEKEQLMQYKNLIKKGFANIKYSKVKAMDGWGRVNPHKALGLYNIRREIRQTLAKENYVDIDMENAHPNILLQICEANDINCKYLKKYVTNRQKYLDEIMQTYNVNKDDAKRLIIRLMYLGGYKSWAEDLKIDKEPISFIKNIKDELKKIGAIFNDEYKDLSKLIEKSKKQKNIQSYNEASSVMSYVLQEWECQILEIVYKYLCSKDLIVNRDCVLCADGIMIRKDKYNEIILDELTNEIKSKFGLNIKFTQKEMTMDYLEQINKIMLEKDVQKKEQHNELVKLTNQSYYQIKNEIEKNYFFIEDIAKFGFYDESDNTFIIKNATSVELCLKPKKYEIYKDNSTIKASFYEKWINDETRRSYKTITFDPQNKDNRKFNLFTGFDLERYVKQNNNVNTNNIHKLLDHVLGEYKNYVLEWFSYILKNKCKTEICIVLYSNNHGVGKNTIIELFLKLIDNKYTAKIEKIDDLTSQFNGNMEGRLLVQGDEILAKTKDLYVFLKNVITRTKVNINKKGVESYDIQDLCNYIFTTNERIPFKIEENDRRISFINCNENKLTDNEYKLFYDDLKDKDILKMFFDELMNMQIPNKIKVLETAIKNEIQNVFISSPIKFLYKRYQILEGEKFSVQELFDMIKNFEKSQNYTELKTTQQMSLALNKVYDFKYRTAKGRGYYFENLEEILKKYNNDLFEEFQI